MLTPSGVWAAMSFSQARSFWSGDGLTAGSPPAAPGSGQYLIWAEHNAAIGETARGYFYVDVATHNLMFRNVFGVTVYPNVVCLVSDQFPTRT